MEWYVAPASPRLEIPGTALVDLVRRMRHAFLNDLQVFAGWLQLGRPTSAVEYLGRVQSRLSEDSRLSLAGDADLEAALLLVGVEAEKRGVPLSFSVAGVPSHTYSSSAAQSDAAAALDGQGWAGRAATGGQTSQAGGDKGPGFAPAVLTLLRAMVERASVAAASLEVSVGAGPSGVVGRGAPAGRIAIRVTAPRVPGEAMASWIGLEAEAMAACGFAPTRGPAGDIGLEWRLGSPMWSTVHRVAESEVLTDEAELIVLSRAGC
jgi:hypothetical protein